MLAETESVVNAASPNVAPTLLSVRSAVKRFGKNEVLRSISLDVLAGEFLTILGESGSGKTTLLRLVAGFEQLDSGEILMEDAPLHLLPPHKRPVNTVFQQYALFPHLTVFENVAYGLRVQGANKSEIPDRVSKALDMVKMTPFSQSKPAKISGGQQQRVALARALVNRPHMLLLDEPLSALDANLRRQMQSELKALQRELGITFLFVTHDQDEAMALSDRIALLRSGKLEQIAAPEEIYRRPATSYVARFIGQANILSCVVRSGLADCGAFTFTCQSEDGRALFSLRPESIHLRTLGTTSTGASFRGKIQSRQFQGSTDLLRVTCSDGLDLLVRLQSGNKVEGTQDFQFDPAAAVRLRESEES